MVKTTRVYCYECSGEIRIVLRIISICFFGNQEFKMFILFSQHFAFYSAKTLKKKHTQTDG